MPPALPLSSETRQSAVDLLWTSRPCPSSADKFRRCLFFVQAANENTGFEVGYAAQATHAFFVIQTVLPSSFEFETACVAQVGH